jgi:dTDP-L-rhamnose 4-epimerase
VLKPVRITEDDVTYNNSMYSLTKHVQEEMLFLVGKLYGVPVTALRCFNVYGPRQSLSNPYTGVAAIFISRLVNGRPPIIYEDGLQTRDFVSVHDVVDALVRCVDTRDSHYQVINIGSGTSLPIRGLAVRLASLLEKNINYEITGVLRANDIRHCTADIRKAKGLLGWSPKIPLDKGLAELIEWSKNQKPRDSFDSYQVELQRKKLL